MRIDDLFGCAILYVGGRGTAEEDCISWCKVSGLSRNYWQYLRFHLFVCKSGGNLPGFPTQGISSSQSPSPPPPPPPTPVHFEFLSLMFNEVSASVIINSDLASREVSTGSVHKVLNLLQILGFLFVIYLRGTFSQDDYLFEAPKKI